jgi:hypothetical protein
VKDVLPIWFFPVLLVWSALWSALAVWRRGSCERDGVASHFWLMSGLWAAVNIGIVAWSFLAPTTGVDEARFILQVNAWLDVGYLIVGAALFSRRRPVLRGFGGAILLQGGFLLALDGLGAAKLVSG